MFSPSAITPVSPRASFKVSNEQFAAFVENTSFVSESEKFGWSFVFHLALSKEVCDSWRARRMQWD